MVNIILVNINDEVAHTFPWNIAKFYNDYSELVYSELSKEPIRSYIQNIIKKENIDSSKIQEIRIRRFPVRHSTPKGSNNERTQQQLGIIFGNYVSTSGIIDIYPPEFPQDMQISLLKERKEAGYYFSLYEPLRILIHELLRVKNSGNEDALNRLANKYMRQFERKTFGGVIFSDRKPFGASLMDTKY